MTKAKMRRRTKATSSANNSRGIMGLTQAISIAAILSFPLAASGDVAGRGALGDRQAGELLESVIEHYQKGEFEPAWEAYRAFFDHPSNRNVDIEVFSRCFFRKECPPLGALAFILGKSEAEAGAFRNFCPDWKDAASGDLSEDEIAEIRRNIRAFRETALGGSCAAWAKRNAAMFQLRSSDRRLAPQVVSLVWPFPHDYTPVTVVEVLGKSVNAWLDTGATMTTLNRQWAHQALEPIEMIQDLNAKYAGFYGQVTLARINRLKLGNAIFSQPVVALTDVSFSVAGKRMPAEKSNIIGMNILLHYNTVCFDWEGENLYLGNLGPCAGGMMPYRNWLTGSQGISVNARVSSQGYVEAKVDTGSNTTYCSPWIMDQIDDRGAFSLGSDEALMGVCTYDPDILFPSWERGAESPENHILLGMDTLGRFAAFGWQLNPLRVYFAPKSNVSDSDGS